jgi:hypothetical protein
MPLTTSEILQLIRDAGYDVEAGTAGYRIRIAATPKDNELMQHIVTEDDEYTAAIELARQLKIDLPV